MKRILLPLVALIAAVTLTVQPMPVKAGAKEDIDRQLNQIRMQEQQTAKKQQQAESRIAELGAKKNQEIVTLEDLQADIAEQGKKLDALELKITDKTLELKKTRSELDEAEKRVAERDKMLKSRVRLMYTNGSVSYLDVLLSANSFSDFIDRFQALESLVGQDKKILEDNKRDRKIIVDRKKTQENQLTEVKGLYAEAETVKQNLMQKEKRSKALIASLSKQQAAEEEVSEDQEASLIQLAQSRQKLYDQKNRILAEERRKAAEAKRKAEEARRAQAGKKSGVRPPAKAASPAKKGGQFAWPVPSSGTITSNFGYRVDPIAHTRKLHKGVDIGAPRGSSVIAAEDGVVLIASWVRGYGNTVVIDHGDGTWTWYGHIMEGGIYVSEGDTVKRGDKIAGVGSTGDSTGNHLHFEVRINSAPVDPLPYIQ